MDLITVFGILLGVGGIVIGNFLEGGHYSALVQITAGVIVFGGTFGATMVGNSLDNIKMGFKLFKGTFRAKDPDENLKIANEINQCAVIARKESILALEGRIESFSNPFMVDVFKYMVDGVDPHILRDVFEKEMDNDEERQMGGARIWSDAGGYAPTIGIIGAILGLIQVMANLTNTTKLGAGIAVAFVATIYGVASANLIFIPIAHKIKRRIRERSDRKEMILEGAIAIIKGYNPQIIQEKLMTYVSPSSTRENL